MLHSRDWLVFGGLNHLRCTVTRLAGCEFYVHDNRFERMRVESFIRVYISLGFVRSRLIKREEKMWKQLTSYANPIVFHIAHTIHFVGIIRQTYWREHEPHQLRISLIPYLCIFSSNDDKEMKKNTSQKNSRWGFCTTFSLFSCSSLLLLSHFCKFYFPVHFNGVETFRRSCRLISLEFHANF